MKDESAAFPGKTGEKRLKVAILGTGNIGTDLLVKCLRSRVLDCRLFTGRNFASPGMRKAMALGVRCSDRGLRAILDEPEVCDLVFDATSAVDHARHWPELKKLGKTCVDLTPARVGKLCVPALNLEECLEAGNVNMITCGGQASLPLARAIALAHPETEYIEVVSSIASRSAGPATRLNIDEYVETTAHALRHFTGVARTKAILILNPAEPCIDMQTTVFARLPKADIEAVRAEAARMTAIVQSYVPGYGVILQPSFENGRVAVMVKVRGFGDYLPRYAGNLDIINCAALSFAEETARRQIGGAPLKTEVANA
jgi:acetaldehyde dehydrogenase